MTDTSGSRLHRLATRVVKTEPASTDGFDALVVPTYRGSTITFPNYESFKNRGLRPRSSYTYGLAGTPTTRTLQNKMTALEGAVDSFIVPSGLMAITTVMLSICAAGETVFLPDNVYPPVRRFATDTLRKFGVDVRFYDPVDPAKTIGAGPPGTKLIWVESPGSVTMEITDLAHIRKLADAHGAYIGCDNSWATPLLCQPLALGADIVVEALTKYLSGHSDVLMGSISVASEVLAAKIHGCIRSLGSGVSPDDCYLVLRGIESAMVRLAHVGAVAQQLAIFAQDFEPVHEVLHPALESFGTHDLFKKQFCGSSGLFSLVLRSEEKTVFADRFEGMNTFQLGASWGGAHSIVAPVTLDKERSVNRRYTDRDIIRVSVGLEFFDDLHQDLAAICR